MRAEHSPETTHRALQGVVLRWMLAQDWCQVGAVEVKNLDVLGVSLPAHLRPSRRTRFPKPRITIAEVKRTRADLLQDLRAEKMHGYAVLGSHMYLAATDEALRWPDRRVIGPEDDVLLDLTERGLPKSWGVLRLWYSPASRWRKGSWQVSTIRACRGGGERQASDEECSHGWPKA